MTPPVFDAYREARLSFKDTREFTTWLIGAFVIAWVVVIWVTRKRRTSSAFE